MVAWKKSKASSNKDGRPTHGWMDTTHNSLAPPGNRDCQATAGIRNYKWDPLMILGWHNALQSGCEICNSLGGSKSWLACVHEDPDKNCDLHLSAVEVKRSPRETPSATLWANWFLRTATTAAAPVVDKISQDISSFKTNRSKSLLSILQPHPKQGTFMF